MTNKDVAVLFVQNFCESKIDLLGPLLTETFRLSGPFFECQSREEYLQKLKEHPPEEAIFNIINCFEDGEQVCLVYDYTKAASTTTIAQLFQFRDQKISEIQLIFDGRGFI